MIHAPAISVIIPLYNKAAYIVRAVRSALAQQPAPAEVLVIDDGSTDEGPRLLEEISDSTRIRVVRQENAGEGAARNRGLSEMRGDLAAFLDADDEWLPGHLRNIVELTQTYPDAGLFATGYRSVYRNGMRVETSISGDAPVLLRDYFETARGGFCIHISSCAVWKHVAEEAGGFAEREPLGADLEFFARVALRHPAALHPAISGVYYVCHAGSALQSQHWNCQYPPVVRLLRAAAPAGSARDYADWILLEHALTGLFGGRRREAVKLLAEVQAPSSQSIRYPRLVRIGAMALPLALLRALVQLRRSRFGVADLPGRNTVVNRVVRSHA